VSWSASSVSLARVDLSLSRKPVSFLRVCRSEQRPHKLEHVDREGHRSIAKVI
jgi:hypothetical protein